MQWGPRGPKLTEILLLAHRMSGKPKIFPKTIPRSFNCGFWPFAEVDFGKVSQESTAVETQFSKGRFKFWQKESSSSGPRVNWFEMACVFLRYFCFRQVLHPSDFIPLKLFGAKSMSWVRCLNVKNKTTFSLRFWCVWETHRFSPSINNSAAWKKGREEV